MSGENDTSRTFCNRQRDRSSRSLTNDFLMMRSVVGSNDYIRVRVCCEYFINRSSLTEVSFSKITINVRLY